MKKFFTIVLGLIILSSTSFAVVAQTDAECKPENIHGDLVEAIALLDTTDSTAFFDGLQTLAIEIGMRQASCNDNVFNSDNEGLQPVLGPIVMKDGIYRAIFETTGFGIIDVTEIEGSCESSGFGSLFNVMAGQADMGAEVIFTAEGCVMLIQVSNTSADWELRFEPIALNN